MILYHGSYLCVEKPDITYSRNNLDFGRGFYTTPIKEQAVKWSERYKPKYGQGVVSIYEFDEAVLCYDSMRVLKFDTYSDEWVDFIAACRRGRIIGEYDIIIGGVANDKVFDTIQLLLDGLIDKARAITRLRYDKPNIQYCFKNQDPIDKYLNFISSEVF